MLLQCVDMLATSVNILAFSLFEIPSFEFFLHDTLENMKRAFRNLYELDGPGQRKLVFCAVIYIIFVLIVTKIFSPKKQALTLKLK